MQMRVKKMEENQDEISVRLKKSEMAAADEYDYRRLEYTQERFLPCRIEEEKEDLILFYKVDGKKPFSGVRKERRDHRLALLLDVGKLLELEEQYAFSLNPENLYYDRCYRVCLMKRDVYPKGERPEAGQVFEEYKALTGYTLQKRYDFEHYRNGGLELLKKNPFLTEIYGCETVQEIQEILAREYEKEYSRIEETKVLVNKDSFFRKKAYGTTLVILCLALAGICGCQQFMINPRNQAIMASDRAFIESDYVGIIDALTPIAAEKLDTHHKYLLAEAYVRSENLKKEQRDNILSALSLNSDERILHYWIAIGRLDAVEAENIAMQCSDDELLLYAYLKEQYLVESDARMDGEQKAKRLSELTKEIEELSGKYMSEEE